MPENPSIAYLSQGRLFIKTADRSPREIESPFGLKVMERDARDRQRNQWKARSPGWQVRANDGAIPFMMGMQGDPSARRISITAVSRGPEPGAVLYTLDTQTVGGLFEYELDSGYERRLVHHADFRVNDLARHATQDVIACSVRYEDGSANIATMPGEGGRLHEVTEGDSMDEAPSWAAGDGKRLVYQSSGIGRDANGFIYGIGPYAVQSLDLDAGDMRTLAEGERFDFLLPRMRADGTLLFIRRPYDPHGRAHVNPLQALGDIVMYPVRLLIAFGAFLNFMSMMFAGKPLTSAGGPKRQGPDTRYLMLWGRYVDVKKAQRSMAKQQAGALVPRSWELMRRDADGGETVLARHVLSYDVTADGGVVYTNGSAVYALDGAGERRELCKARMVERVVALG